MRHKHVHILYRSINIQYSWKDACIFWFQSAIARFDICLALLLNLIKLRIYYSASKRTDCRSASVAPVSIKGLGDSDGKHVKNTNPGLSYLLNPMLNVLKKAISDCGVICHCFILNYCQYMQDDQFTDFL